MEQFEICILKLIKKLISRKLEILYAFNFQNLVYPVLKYKNDKTIDTEISKFTKTQSQCPLTREQALTQVNISGRESCVLKLQYRMKRLYQSCYVIQYRDVFESRLFYWTLSLPCYLRQVESCFLSFSAAAAAASHELDSWSPTTHQRRASKYNSLSKEHSELQDNSCERNSIGPWRR